MNFYIANPVSGATPTFDGFNGRIWMGAVKPGGATAVSSYVEWMGIKPAVDGTGTDFIKDLKPASAYDETTDTTDNWWTDPTEATRLPAVTAANTKAVGHENGEGLCVESWVLSSTAVACVRVKGTVYRNMKTSVLTYALNNVNGDTP